MAARRVNVSLSEELFQRLERARGDVSRSRFVERALESALTGPLERGAEGRDVREPGPDVAGSNPALSAPSRASIPSNFDRLQGVEPRRYGPKRDVKPVPKNT